VRLTRVNVAEMREIHAFRGRKRKSRESARESQWAAFVERRCEKIFSLVVFTCTDLYWFVLARVCCGSFIGFFCGFVSTRPACPVSRSGEEARESPALAGCELAFFPNWAQGRCMEFDLPHIIGNATGNF
jgi:hypothetical protein